MHKIVVKLDPAIGPNREVEFDTPEAAFAALPGHQAIVGATDAYVVDDKGKRVSPPNDQSKKEPEPLPSPAGIQPPPTTNS
jgi:hypothetical protein